MYKQSVVYSEKEDYTEMKKTNKQKKKNKVLVWHEWISLHKTLKEQNQKSKHIYHTTSLVWDH